MDPSATVRVYSSFERIILDGFYEMRLRNDLMCGVRSREALCRWLAIYSKHEANLLKREAQLGRRFGLGSWAFGFGEWMINSASRVIRWRWGENGWCKCVCVHVCVCTEIIWFHLHLTEAQRGEDTCPRTHSVVFGCFPLWTPCLLLSLTIFQGKFSVNWIIPGMGMRGL